MSPRAFAALIVVSPLFAQSGLPTITGEVKQNYERTKDLMMRAVEKMPEDGYAFRSSPQTRSYAQLINHISEAQDMVCGGVIGQLAHADTSKSDKMSVVAELKKSFDLCDRAYETLTEGNASMVGGSGFMGGTLVGRLYANIIHDNEMYGTIAVYLRLKNIVPPSSESRTGK